MALTYNKRTRALDIRGTIVLTDGTEIDLNSRSILAYSINESSGSDGLPLGTAESASYSLTISNVGKNYTPNMFDNAEVHMEIGIENNGHVRYSSFGVWYVCDISAPEQSVSIDLNGYDALATLFETQYTDSKGAYPTTLGSLAATICSAAGIRLKSSAFANAGISVKAMPEWEDEVTLRDIIAYISACAGGFARVARDGKLEIVSYADGNNYTLDSTLYTTLTRTNGLMFKFNALEVTYVGEDEPTRFRIDGNIESAPTNTIQIEDNPLFTQEIALAVVNELANVQLTAAVVNWVGDPAVCIGDKLTITDTSNNRFTMMINSQSIEFAGGLNFESECALPTSNTISSGSYTSNGNVLDSNGNVRATRVSGLDSSIVSATVGHFERLDSSSITTDTLMSAIINATRLRAESIDSGSVETDALTAAMASIIEATIKKLKAGTINTDNLFAGIAEIVQLKTSSITAETIDTDEFAAAFAAVTVLAAGTATFDRATVQHLVAQALNLQYGVGEDVFISNLRVAYAQMVSAAIGNLCIKASDGNYYTIDVNADGTVTATQTTVSDGEAAAGQTDAGRVILGTDITAENLNTGNLLATYALVNKIDAARIDVDQLLARQAFVDALYTSRIFGGKSLEVIIGDLNDSSRIFRSETQPTSNDAKITDLWIIPSTGETWQAADADSNLVFYLDDDGNIYYETADEDTTLTISDDALYTDGTVIPVDENGVPGLGYVWVLVRDSYIDSYIETNDLSIETIRKNQAEIDKKIKALGMMTVQDSDGIHIHRPIDNPQCEVLITDNSMNVKTNNIIASTFAASFIEQGGQIVVRSTSNGLIFGG